MTLQEKLSTIYGADAATQQPRYQQAIARFSSIYGHGPIDLFRAPGRVNIIGEHTDYNHGYVLPAALDKDVLLLTRPRTDGEIHLANVETAYPPVQFAISDAIPSAPPGDWGNYSRGAAQTIHQALGRPQAGFDALVSAQAPWGVPRGAGLSSSSALTVVFAVALCHYAQWQPGPAQLAALCSDAEWYVGTRGGIMDQFISLLGARDQALFLDCRPDAEGHYHTDHLPLPADYRLLVVDSGVKHSNTRGDFNRRVAACRVGAQLLKAQKPNITHLRDVEDEDWSLLEAVLPGEMAVDVVYQQGLEIGEIPGLTPETVLRVRACCRHVWSENHRVLTALDAMRQGDIATLGDLLNRAHASARDDYQISCPELEVLIEAANQVEGVAGARLTGAGWGGCMIALVHQDAVADFEAHVANRFQASVGRTPPIFPCRATAGAGLVLAIDN